MVLDPSFEPDQFEVAGWEHTGDGEECFDGDRGALLGQFGEGGVGAGDLADGDPVQEIGGGGRWSGEQVVDVAVAGEAGEGVVVRQELEALRVALQLHRGEAQVFLRVQLPLALPVVVAGVRTAAVEVVASATLAAFVGAGGLGRFITSGLTLLDYSLLFVGAIPVALLALFAEASLAGIERLVTPPASS